jgi:CheY-like chemotaxis protein
MSTDDKPVEVLLVEDNPRDAELVLRALKKRRLANNIVRVNDGQEALDFLFCEGQYAGRRKDLPRVVLLDLKLPKIGGDEVLRRIRGNAHTRLLPVVVMTNSQEESDLLASYTLGANSYIVKPVEFENFSEAVAALGFYWLLLNQTPPLPGSQTSGKEQ